MIFGSGPPPPTTPPTCAEIRELLSGFALEALEPSEEARVRAHLEGCEDCRADAAELRAVVRSMAEAVPEVSPPPQLRERILAQARAENAARSESAEPVRSPSSPVPWRPSRWSPWIATAAAAVLALSAGGWALAEHFSPHSPRAGVALVSLPPVEQLIAKGDATVVTLRPSQGANARGALVTDPASGATYLLLSGVPELHSQKVYALWYMAEEGGNLTPVLIGQMKHQGAYRIARSPSGFTQLALTREPRPGDKVPKGPILLEAALS